MARKRKGKPAAVTRGAAPRESWDDRRRRVRQELIDEGLRQFQSRGFDRVTVSEIVAKVDISRRSFFRYFDSKDDLAFSWMEDAGELMRPVLAQRLKGQDLLNALRDAFLEIAKHFDREPDRPTRLTQLVFGTPSLQGRYQVEYARWQTEFAKIAQRVKKSPESKMFELRVQSALAITAYASALQEWARQDHRKPLKGYVVTAFGMLLKGGGKR